MNRSRIEVAVGVGAVVLVALVLAIAVGVGPFGGDSDAIDDFPTPTSTPSGGGDTGGGDGGSTEGQTTQPPFDLQVDSVEECGRTCRDVTATLENQQDRRATGVTVYTRIHAGRGTDGDVVWEGSHEVGTLESGGTDTETQRVELSYFESLAIQREDGWVTIVTTVDTDRQTVTFQERRDVG